MSLRCERQQKSHSCETSRTICDVSCRSAQCQLSSTMKLQREQDCCCCQTHTGVIIWMIHSQKDWKQNSYTLSQYSEEWDRAAWMEEMENFNQERKMKMYYWSAVVAAHTYMLIMTSHSYQTRQVSWSLKSLICEQKSQLCALTLINVWHEF